MLFESIGQGWIFLLILHLGICCALFDEIWRLIPFVIKKLNIKKTINKIEKNSTKITFAPKQKIKQNNKIKFKFAKKIIKNISICFRVLVCFAIFYLGVLFINYGEMRIYLILAFVVGFWLERTFLADGVKKLWRKVYNGYRGEKNERKNEI